MSTVSLRHNIDARGRSRTHLGHQVYRITRQVVIIASSDGFGHSDLRGVVSARHVSVVVISRNVPTSDLRNLQGTKIRIVLIKRLTSSL